MMNLKIYASVLWVMMNFQLSIAQIDNPEWLSNLDSNNFEVFNKRKHISSSFLDTKKWTRKNIASLDGNFKAGCTGKGKRTRLNWVAKNDSGLEFYSFSFGGIGFHTRYYVFSKNHIREIEIRSKSRYESFNEFMHKLFERTFILN